MSEVPGVVQVQFASGDKDGQVVCAGARGQGVQLLSGGRGSGPCGGHGRGACHRLSATAPEVPHVDVASPTAADEQVVLSEEGNAVQGVTILRRGNLEGGLPSAEVKDL